MTTTTKKTTIEIISNFVVLFDQMALGNAEHKARKNAGVLLEAFNPDSSFWINAIDQKPNDGELVFALFENYVSDEGMPTVVRYEGGHWIDPDFDGPDQEPIDTGALKWMSIHK